MSGDSTMCLGSKAATIALGLLLTAMPMCGQTNPPPKPAEEFENESNPTQTVFLSVRNQYLNRSDGNWTNALAIRSDRIFMRKHKRLSGKAGILTRFDLPVAISEVGGTTHAGLGDLYAQALHVPWLTPRFAVALGSGITIPTATHRTLGGGKWVSAPLLVPVWFFPERKGFFFVKLHQFVSFAGPSDRRDFNYLLSTPTLVYRFRPRWWVGMDTEVKTDWEQDNQVSFRSGLEIGHVVKPRYALAVKLEVPWGGHREAAPSVPGDWALKQIITRYRRRD